MNFKNKVPSIKHKPARAFFKKSQVNFLPLNWVNRGGQVTSVHVFSSGDETELFFE